MHWLDYYKVLNKKFQPYQEKELLNELKQPIIHPFLDEIWDSIITCVENQKWISGAILGFTLSEWIYNINEYEHLRKPPGKLYKLMKKEATVEHYQSFFDEVKELRNKFMHIELDVLTPSAQKGNIIIATKNTISKIPTEDRYLTLQSAINNLCFVVVIACKFIFQRYFQSRSGMDLYIKDSRLLLTAFKKLIKWSKDTGYILSNS